MADIVWALHNTWSFTKGPALCSQCLYIIKKNEVQQVTWSYILQVPKYETKKKKLKHHPWTTQNSPEDAKKMKTF